MQIKTCSKCKIEKSLLEFTNKNNGKLGVHSHCKLCRAKTTKNWRKSNKIIFKKYLKKHKEQIKNNQLKRKYRITVNDYNQMLKEQNDVCAICGQKETIKILNNKNRDLSVDHNHKTGKVRGLLCGRCNKMLGVIKDDDKILQSAMNYLNKE